jgi:hypothetical protein
MKDSKLFIFVSVFLTSLIIDKIPYVNIFFGDKIWVLYLCEVIFFILLFFPYRKFSALRTVLFLFLTNTLLLAISMIFSFFKVTVIPEILGILIYFSFWIILTYLIIVLTKFKE